MDAYERLVHYAEVSAESELSRAPLSVYKLSNATVHRRNKAVNWIKIVCSYSLAFNISIGILCAYSLAISIFVKIVCSYSLVVTCTH